jgi:hypothetical protein
MFPELSRNVEQVLVPVERMLETVRRLSSNPMVHMLTRTRKRHSVINAESGSVHSRSTE